MLDYYSFVSESFIKRICWKFNNTMDDNSWGREFKYRF